MWPTGRPVEDPAKRPRLDYKATDICPSWMGGKNWQPMSFNPATGLVYVTTNNMCQDMKPRRVNYRRGAFYLGNDFAVNPGHGDHLGQLLALDPATQKPAWTMDLPLPWNGGTMTTAGNLVFFGDINGMFHALDAKTGKPLWEMNVGSGVGAGPMTFSVDGKQYIAILVGTRRSRRPRSWARSARRSLRPHRKAERCSCSRCSDTGWTLRPGGVHSHRRRAASVRCVALALR